MENLGNSFERRIVLFVDSNTLYRLQKNDADKKILVNPELKIVEIGSSEKFLTSFRILGDVLPSNNMMLILSPFDDNTYIEISDAKNQIALDKLGNTIQLCQYLGASKVAILRIKMRDKKTDQSLSFDGKYGTVSGELTSKLIDINNLKGKIEIITSFKGSEPNYQMAKNFLSEKKMLGDVFLSKLLEMRNPNAGKINPLQSITKEINLTENLQNIFDLVSNIKFPVGYFTANYKSITEERIETSLEIKIDF